MSLEIFQFQNKFATFAILSGRPCSLKDRITDSGSVGPGSIPSGGTEEGAEFFSAPSFFVYDLKQDLATGATRNRRKFRGRRCRFTDRRRRFRSRRCRFRGRRRRFRVSTVQVPKQGRDLHRESAFYVAPVALVSVLKWNRRHLRLNLRRLSLNLRHRGASGLFRNSPADVRTKNLQSSEVAMYVHR